ncbi:RHS repeat-associated core domain-containing protein [Lentisphaerota bacterium WC36G]|nr:RHS repeat-associated core domain-containing protein [Lentisphaerae bacterium WC36]
MVFNYIADGNKNITQLINLTTGEIANKYDYSPFGQLAKTDENVENVFKFSSECAEKETGLIYYNYRYYNPTTGKWTKRDTVQELGGENLYGFTFGDSINYFDFLGLTSSTYFPGIGNRPQSQLEHSDEEFESDYNDDDKIGVNNCYTYACGFDYSTDPKKGNKPPLNNDGNTNGMLEPGSASRKGSSIDPNSDTWKTACEKLKDGAVSDKRAKRMEEGQTSCPKCWHRVALVITDVKGQDNRDIDYHWYREHSDGSWSHKRGKGKVTDKDASKNKIKNPKKADRDYTENGKYIYRPNYKHFCGYMCAKDEHVK